MRDVFGALASGMDTEPGKNFRGFKVVTTENSKKISDRLELVRVDGNEGLMTRMLKVTGVKRTVIRNRFS